MRSQQQQSFSMSFPGTTWASAARASAPYAISPIGRTLLRARLHRWTKTWGESKNGSTQYYPVSQAILPLDGKPWNIYELQFIRRKVLKLLRCWWTFSNWYWRRGVPTEWNVLGISLFHKVRWPPWGHRMPFLGQRFSPWGAGILWNGGITCAPSTIDFTDMFEHCPYRVSEKETTIWISLHFYV